MLIDCEKSGNVYTRAVKYISCKPQWNVTDMNCYLPVSECI